MLGLSAYARILMQISQTADGTLQVENYNIGETMTAIISFRLDSSFVIFVSKQLFRRGGTADNFTDRRRPKRSDGRGYTLKMNTLIMVFSVVILTCRTKAGSTRATFAESQTN